MFTPTEAAAIAVCYALFIGLVVYRNVSFNTLIKCLETTAETMSDGVPNNCCCKHFWLGYFGSTIAPDHSPRILSLTQSPTVFLVFVNLFLLFMGMIMEAGANVILLAPIFAPVAAQRD